MAASYALQADCLLRLDRIDEAIAAWRQSEDAPNGNIESMESLVCAIHREPAPYKQRAAYLTKAVQDGDVIAAAQLIALDCEFPDDWWNEGPKTAYLAHDLPAVISALKLPEEDIRVRSLRSVAECAAADEEDKAAIATILGKYHVLIDAEQTLPEPGILIPYIVRVAIEGQAIDESAFITKFGGRLLELAKESDDAALWNTALFATLPADYDAQLAIEREAWKATGGEKFARAVLLLKQSDDKLKGDDAELAAALKQFPENGAIYRIAYEVAKKGNDVTMELLASAARAEFTHFSSYTAFATVIDRPRAGYLREYVREMERIRAAQETPVAP